MKLRVAKVGIIGGSGVGDLLFTQGFEIRNLSTEYGEVKIKKGAVDGKTVIFLNRHGENYTPPSLVNYRANIAALKSEGIEAILATAAVGSMNLKMRPGNLAMLTDFIDFTRGRVETFDPKSFVDVSCPYSPLLIKKIINAGKKLRLKIHPGAIYVCTEGPRFETKAEIKMFSKMGADVVGMTQVPEVVLAAEAEIPYAAVAVVTNYAAGISPRKITSEEVIDMMQEKSKILSQLILQVIKSL